MQVQIWSISLNLARLGAENGNWLGTTLGTGWVPRLRKARGKRVGETRKYVNPSMLISATLQEQ